MAATKLPRSGRGVEILGLQFARHWIKPLFLMKNPSGALKCALMAIALLPIVGCEKCAQVRPGWETSKKGCAEISRILGKYNESLYRFQTFKKGKLVSEKGTLSPADMPAGTIRQVAQEAKDQKLTGCAIQAGRCPEENFHQRNSSTHPLAVEKMTDLWKLEKVLNGNH